MRNHAHTTSLRTRSTRVALLAMFALAAGLTGCGVTQTDYDRLVIENRTLGNRNQELVASLEECEAARDALGSTRTSSDSSITSLQAQLREKDALLTDYEAAIADLEARMQGLSFGALDPITDAALADLAASHPDLLSYDSAQGMLRFNSDLTFGSGSDTVSDGAKATLRALASILKGSSAAQYDLIIVGHTDSQRIGANTARRHPSNMHLSCHRAISVRKELMGLGVAGSKIQAAGWGDQRPLVPNTASGNTPANRRVEIYLGRSVGGSGTLAPASTSGSAPTGINIDRETPPNRQPGITK